MRPAIPVVDVVEANDRLAKAGPERPILVDVRNPDEFEQARVDGAVLMPLPMFAARCRELPTDRPLLLICRSGNRSAAATGHLLALGYTDAANVEGGIVAWYRAGLPIRTGVLDPGEGDLAGEVERH
jgi:rhodanese-related sulfurtransferase